MASRCYLVLSLIPILFTFGDFCKYPFEGFGVYLGKLESFNRSSEFTQREILDRLYNDLKIRLFRTEYLPSFSPAENQYEIQCRDWKSCTWITMHSLLKELPQKDIFVSIWSPPSYMKNYRRELKIEYEENYRNYLNNITVMIEEKFNFTVKKISLSNEPENIFAEWDECSMSAEQLCRLVQEYDDPKFRVCPENAYFWMSKIYRNYNFKNINCKKACTTTISHGYQMNLNIFSLNFGRVYYDLTKYAEESDGPVWITEISSTELFPAAYQMKEAIDLSTSIVHFVGTTCVQRYYFWYAYTSFESGESLIWGSNPFLDTKGTLFYPKKYWAFRHFTRAAHKSSNRFDCSTDKYLCLKFEGKKVFVNKEKNQVMINDVCPICCTTESYDYQCGMDNILPAKSICSC